MTVCRPPNVRFWPIAPFLWVAEFCLDRLMAELGKRLMAVVEPQVGVVLDVADVRRQLKASLADYKVPKHLEVQSNLPREDSGKIFRRSLRAPYWERAGRRI
jgi:long-chain acyl-CoA synthetase